MQDTLEELDIRLEVRDTLELLDTLATLPEVQDTLEELDILPQVQDTLELLDTHQEVMAIPREDILQEERQDTLLEELTLDTPLEAMVIHQVDTLQEEPQGTLLEELTLLEATDTRLEVMDTHLVAMDTLLEVMDTQLEDTDTPLEVMDIQLEGMDTLQAAIRQDILLEGIQDLLEVDTTDTTGKNKTPLMLRGLLNDAWIHVIGQSLEICWVLHSLTSNLIFSSIQY